MGKVLQFGSRRISKRQVQDLTDATTLMLEARILEPAHELVRSIEILGWSMPAKYRWHFIRVLQVICEMELDEDSINALCVCLQVLREKYAA